MSEVDCSGDVIEMIRGNPDLNGREGAFLDDLCLALEACNGNGDGYWAPYNDPGLGCIRPEVRFPNHDENGYGSTFSFDAQAFNSWDNLPEPLRWYGLPMHVRERASLRENGFLDKGFDVFRNMEGIPDDDGFLRILTEVCGTRLTKFRGRDHDHYSYDHHLDLSLRNLLLAHKKEMNISSFSVPYVQEVSIVVPASPGYRLAAVGHISHNGNGREAMCFCYGHGRTLFRRRPVLDPGTGDYVLFDFRGGEGVPFKLDAPGYLEGNAAARMGDLTVMAMPVVGGGSPMYGNGPGNFDGSRSVGVLHADIWAWNPESGRDGISEMLGHYQK